MYGTVYVNSRSGFRPDPLLIPVDFGKLVPPKPCELIGIIVIGG